MHFCLRWKELQNKRGETKSQNQNTLVRDEGEDKFKRNYRYAIYPPIPRIRYFLQQQVLLGKIHQPSNIFYVQLAKNIPAVGVDGKIAEKKFGGNFFGAHLPAYHAYDAYLSFSKLVFF